MKNRQKRTTPGRCSKRNSIFCPTETSEVRKVSDNLHYWLVESNKKFVEQASISQSGTLVICRMKSPA